MQMQSKNIGVAHKQITNFSTKRKIDELPQPRKPPLPNEKLHNHSISNSLNATKNLDQHRTQPANKQSLTAQNTLSSQSHSQCRPVQKTAIPESFTNAAPLFMVDTNSLTVNNQRNSTNQNWAAINNRLQTNTTQKSNAHSSSVKSRENLHLSSALSEVNINIKRQSNVGLQQNYSGADKVGMEQ